MTEQYQQPRSGVDRRQADRRRVPRDEFGSSDRRVAQRRSDEDRRKPG